MLPFDMIARGEDTLVDWDSRTWSYGDNMSVSGRECVENESFRQLSSPVKTGKHESMGDGFFDRVGGGRTVAQVMSISRAFSGVVESNSSLVEENSNREASPFDLKLGRFPRNQIDVRGPNLSRGTPMVLPSGLSTRAKRSRAGGASSQTAYCQVYGCNKDLSSSKDYHKKHKVCEVHSKTSRVIVNGSEQRFCQQCSRFHLLSEFDDGKRSCRKRLAGHNERRRKPQVGTLSGRPGRVLQSYNGGRCQGLAFSAASFICQDLLPSGLHRSDKYGLNDLCRQVKIEEATNYCPLSAIPKTNGGRDSKSVFSYGYEKQFSNFNVNETKTATRSIFGDNTSKYHNDLQSSNSDSLSLFQETSLGNDGYNIFDAASIIRGLSGIPDSRCAFSPLSSQSQNSSSHSSGNPMAHSLVVLGNTPYSTNKYSEKLIGVSSEASFNGLSNKLPSNALGSKVRTDLCPLLISASNEVNFQIANEISQGSEFMNSKQSLSCEDGPTINLLQLSSQLQRVENQRQSVPVKQENDNFCYRQIN